MNTAFFGKLTLGVLAATSVLAAGSASAVNLTFTDEIVNFTTTNFNTSLPGGLDDLSIPQFDPSLGTLQSVKFDLLGFVQGTAQAESLDAAPTTITLNLSATINATSGAISLAQVIPLDTVTADVSAFDGTIDFGGPSGVPPTTLSDDESDSVTFLPADAAFALFVGNGSVPITIAATGASSGSGAGNLLTLFNTSARAEVTVEYHFTPVDDSTPEPATLLGLGVVSGAGFLFKRKKGA